MKKDKLKITVIDHENGYIGPSCMRGFQSIGHTVQLLKLKGNEKTNVLESIDMAILLSDIIQFGPDLILDINGKACDRDGLSLTSYRILNIPVFIWFVDNPLIALNYGNYKYSYLFTKLVYDKHQCEEMKQLGMSDAYHLPLGADDSCFRPLILNHADRLKYHADISFVGNSYADKCEILRDVLKNKWPNMPEEMNGVIEFASDTLKNGTKKDTPSVYKEALDHFSVSPYYPQDDIPWLIYIIIENDSGRDYRAELVQTLLKNGIHIYGNKSWLTLFDNCMLRPEVHYFDELPKVYNASLINLNISRTQLVTAVNQRVFDVPACRSFLLTDFKDELEEYFSIGKEIICYRDKEDLSRLAGYYLNNPGQMKQIAEAGYHRVLSEHTYTARMERIIEIYKNMPDRLEQDEKGESWNEANLLIGQAYLKLSNRQKADIHFKNALNSDSAKYICRLNTVGVSLLQQKDYEGSIPIFLKASALDEDEVSFLTNLGLAYKNTGKYADAVNYYKKALEKDPNNTLVKKCLDDLYMKTTPPSPPLARGWKEEDKNGISLCMIVKNEETNLARCLTSVREIVDEIIIVDTGSEDRTLEIAKGFGAKVHKLKWNDNFSEARNVSLDLAEKEWILVLDADEIIAECDVELLKLLCRSKEYDAFSIVTRNYINDSKGAIWIPNDNSYEEGNGYAGWYPSSKVRLFRNDRRIRFSGVIHELVEKSIRELKFKIGETAIPVHHYGSVNAGLSSKDKRIKYINYCRKKIEEEPENPKAYYEYGIECCEFGLHADAVEAFKKVIELNPDFPFVYGYLGASLIAIGLHSEAIVYLKMGRDKEPENPGLYNNLASAYYEIGDYRTAITFYKKAIDIKPEYVSVYKNIGLSYLKLNDIRNAVESFEKALMLNPNLDDVSMLLNELKKDNVKKTKLSLCMIVRDEEDVLKNCLESVSCIVDEIVIVDTGSKDNTIKIASSYGAKIINAEWKDDFSEARNISIQNALGDYILWLDADEYISKESIEELLKLKSSFPENKNEAYSVIITSMRDNQQNNIEDESFRRLRIFPNLQGVEFKGKVHEDVNESLYKLGIKINPLNVEVMHTGYKNDNEVKLKIKRNIQMLLKQNQDVPGDSITSFYLANSYHSLGDISQAIKYMKEVIVYGYNSSDEALSNYGSQTETKIPSPFAMSGEGKGGGGQSALYSNRKWLPFAFIKLAQFYRESDKQNDIFEIYDRLFKIYPQFTLGHFFFGEILYYQGNYDDAIREFEQFPTDKIEVYDYPVPMRKTVFLKYYYLGCCYLERGNYNDAAFYFEKAKEMDADSVNLHISIARLFALTGDIGVCVDMCNIILKDLNILINETINSIDDLSGIYRTIGSSLEGKSYNHEALQAYKTAVALNNLRSVK